MKVILLKDIENLGKKFEVKQVANGYARNFLIPKGLVKPVTKENLEWLELQKQTEVAKAEEELKQIQETVSKLDGVEVMVSVKIGDEGKIFGSITKTRISELLKGLGFEVGKSQIELESPIKEIGEWPVKVSFPHGLEAEIKVIVTEAKAER